MRIIFYIFILFIPYFVTGQNSSVTYDIKQISSLEGLSKNSVNTICIDRIGYVWIGTSFGLNRYDGREVRNYYHIPTDGTSVSGNRIVDLYESGDGTLWIITVSGICKYNYKTDCFQQIHIGNWFHNSSEIIEDDKFIWFFGERDSILWLDKTTNSFEKGLLQTNYGLGYIKDIVEYDDDNFVFICPNKGAFLVNKTSLLVEPFFVSEGENFVGIEEAEDGYYLASRKNIYHLAQNGDILNHEPGLLNKLNGPIVLGVKYNSFENTVWVTTDGDGILIFDTDLNFLGNIKSGIGINGFLPDNSIRTLEFFDTKTVFLGTVRAGTVILHQSQFKEYRQFSGPGDETGANTVNLIVEDENKDIWLGTDGKGLFRYKSETESFSGFYHPEVTKITGLANFSSHYLLVASYLKGVYVFDKKKEKFIPSKQHPILKNISDQGHIRFYKDWEQHVWIASSTHLYRINPITGQITEPLKDADIDGYLKNPYPYLFATETRNKDIWFCASGGLLCFSLSKNKFINHIDISDYPNINGIVYSAIESGSGNLIFSCGNNLYEYDSLSKNIILYLDSEQKYNRMYYSLYYEPNGQIWAGTNKGIVRIDTNDSTSKLIQFNNLGEIGGNEFRHGAILFASDSLLYLGSYNGLTAFNPGTIVFDDTEMAVTISSFSKKGIKRGTELSETLAFNVQDSCRVRVKYSPTSYNFRFNTFSFLDEGHTEYAYTLENFENIWHRGNLQEASYSNLSPGEYIFRVKATNRNGIMAEKTTRVYLKILPDWYQTLWFKLLLILLVFTIAFVIWRESLNRAKLKNQLVFEKLEQDKLKEINQMKLRFFTNISHELKTPLTLILAPLEHLVRQKSSPTEMAKLFPFLYRNARRMNQLITQLLEFRKAEMSALKLNFQKADLLVDCQDVINHFKHQSEIEGVALQLKSNSDSYSFVYDRDKFFKILFNLLSNALKHTSKGDNIVVEIVEELNEGICIKVEDTGTGIPKEKLDSIFDRFYMADHKQSGTGIGLAFTKKLVELHHGKISVDSKVGEGTVFTIFLPNSESETQFVEMEPEPVFRQIERETNFVDQKNSKDDKTKPQILIIEDEWELRKYLVQLLSNQYQILEAKNGEQGIEIALKEMPDLVLSDLMMPIMDGYELCKQLKNDLRISHIPVILLTAKAETEHKLKGYKLGADAYISKPFNSSILLSQINAILRNRALLKERFSHDLDLQPEVLSYSNEDEKFLHKAISIVEINMENPGFGVPDFVSEIGMGRTLVYNKTKAITGKTINEFILHIRMRRAAQFLRETDNSVTAIAINCGFSDQSYFSTAFKKYFELSPTEYRNKKE